MTDVNDLAKAGTLPDSVEKVATPANKKAEALVESRFKLLSERELLKAGVDQVTRPRKQQNILTTTHWEMDRDTGGFQEKQVWFIAANSGFGKTSLTIAQADEQIKAGRRPLIVTGEDPEELYGNRLLMRRTRVDRYRFAEGKLTASELSACVDAAQRASSQPLYLEAIGKSVEKTCKEVSRIIQLEGIDMVYFDYVQAFQTEKKITEEHLIVKHVGRTIIDCIKTATIAGAALSQITQDDSKPIPKKEMMRYCKDLGIFAEVVAMGFESKDRVERNQDGQRVVIAEQGERCILIDKNKPGPGPFSGRIYRMGSDSHHGCFDVVPSPTEETDRYVDSLTADYAQNMPPIPWNEHAER